MDKIIYLDNNSTTKVDPRVFEAIAPYFIENYGNSSSSHILGVKSNEAVNHAKNQVAELIGCNEREIYFTSGATESINFALKGIVNTTPVENPHIITVKTEHPAVLDTCKWLEGRGVNVTYLNVQRDGLINIEDLKTAIKPNTILICTMIVNNETGVIQPIKEISKIAHEHNILFMSDGTQAVGKMPVNVYELGIDILCFSGHKFYATKGIGGIFLRSKRPFKPKLEPLFHGGGHESGMRSGTLNVPGIVGIGMAAEISRKEMAQETLFIQNLRDYLEREMLKIPGTHINGNVSNRIHTTTSIRFDDVDADAIISALKFIAVSNGSACSSHSIEPSHVLLSMGLSEAETFSSVRFSLGRFTKKEDISTTVEIFNQVISNLRKFTHAL